MNTRIEIFHISLLSIHFKEPFFLRKLNTIGKKRFTDFER